MERLAWLIWVGPKWHHKYPYVYIFFFLGPHLWHVVVSRLEVKSELQLLAYTTATTTQDPRHICDCQSSLPRHQILNPLSKARDQTLILMDTSQFCFCCSTMGTSKTEFLISLQSCFFSVFMIIVKGTWFTQLPRPRTSESFRVAFSLLLCWIYQQVCQLWFQHKPWTGLTLTYSTPTQVTIISALSNL